MKASVWKKIRSFLVDWGKPVVFGLLLAFLCSQFFRIAVVEGDSMEPTLQDGQVLLLQTGFLKEENLKRGDIIVASKKIPEKTQIIKRVIGLPGEHLEILDNEVYINGEKLEENYLDEPMKTENLDVYIPEGKLFVMGDHPECICGQPHGSHWAGGCEKRSDWKVSFLKRSVM